MVETGNLAQKLPSVFPGNYCISNAYTKLLPGYYFSKNTMILIHYFLL